MYRKLRAGAAVLGTLGTYGRAGGAVARAYGRSKAASYRRRRAAPAVPRGIRSNSIVLTRSFDGYRTGQATSQILTTLNTLSGSTFTGTSAIFQVSDLSNVSQYIALFAQYKILKVKLMFIPVYNSYPAVGVSGTGTSVASTFGQPQLMVATDEDGAFTNSNLASQLAYTSNKVYAGSTGAGFMWSKASPPHFNTVQIGGATSTATATSGVDRGWLSLLGSGTGASVDHFGCAIGVHMPIVPNTTAAVYHVITTMTVALRHAI